MIYELDKIDHRILAVLHKNARITNNELAERVSLSPSPCWQRVRRLVEQGYIKNHVTILDQTLLGMPDTAIIEIRLERHSSGSFENFGKKLASLSEVIEVYAKTGEFEFLVKVAVNGSAGLDNFIQNKLYLIPGIRETRSNFILRCLKQSYSYLPDGHDLES